MIVITLNANSGYDIAALNAKEICLFRTLIIMHIDQEAYIYIYMIYITQLDPSKIPSFLTFSCWNLTCRHKTTLYGMDKPKVVCYWN